MALRVHIPTGLMNNSNYRTQIKPASSSSSSGGKSLIIEARSLKQKQTKEKEKKQNYNNIPNSNPAPFDIEMAVLEQLERMFRSSNNNNNSRSDPLIPQFSGPFSPSPSIGFSGRRPIRVAYQGVRGSYCQEAALKAFPNSSNCDTFACCNSMEDAFKALEDKSADRAIIPVENSIDGIIDRNLDLLLRHDNVEIVGELIIPVNHCLLAMPGTSRSELKRIVSHPQALSHCKSKLLQWLDLEVDEVSNAADVARYVSENRITDTAVIGSKIAAKEFGLTVLEENFQDRDENFNRFLQLGLEKTCSSSSSSSSFGLNKTVTTVAFCLEKGVSDLYRALAIFEQERGNITVRRVEHRPNRLNPVLKKTGEHRYFDYVFILDLEVENNVSELETALSRLEEISGFIRVLGSYKSG